MKFWREIQVGRQVDRQVSVEKEMGCRVDSSSQPEPQ